MSIGIFNRDSSFFTVDTPALSSYGKTPHVRDEDILSFTVEEELGKILSGSLRLHDPNHIYSRIYHPGTRLSISWGYKLSSQDPRSFLVDKTAGVLTGRGYRSAVSGHVTSPSGGGGNDGQVTFSMNWYGSESRYGQSPQKFSSGTKSTVISAVMSKMDIPATGQYIDFRRGNEVINLNTEILQFQSNFRFMLDKAIEWGAVFKVGQDSNGNSIALFCDFGSPLMDTFSKLCGNAIFGSRITLGYKAGGNSSSTPVKEYTWQNRMGMNGSGDNVQITMINGQPQFHRFNAETQTVETWKLNPEKIKAELRKRGNVKDKVSLMKAWTGAKTFEEVKWAFDKSVDTTAPQGAGYSMSVKLIGNPCITAGVRADFSEEGSGEGGGFPDFCYPKAGSKKIDWYVQKVSHTIDRSGYNMDGELVDAFTLNNGVMVR